MANNLPDPASRKEEFLAKAAGKSGITLPEPASREEEYLNAIAKGGGGGGTTYTAGDGIDITDDTISVDTDTIQEKLTAGTGIDITDNTISATGGGGGGDTVYSDKSTSDGATGGAVYIGNLNSSQEEQPDPTTTDNHYKYFWALPGINTSLPDDRSVNIMGNNAGPYSTSIGSGANIPPTLATYGVAIGYSSTVRSNHGVALGASAYIDSNLPHSVALGDRSNPTRAGEVNVGQSLGQGYNNTNYRVIGGVHDPVDAHDAATKGYVDAHAGGSGGIKFLSASDFNYDDGNTGSFNTVAMWLLDDGFYFMPSDYTAVPVKGALDGTNVGHFNTAISNKSFYCFIKANNCFWMFVNSSIQDASLYANRPIFFCKINPANGWFTPEDNYQLAKRSELTA